MGRPRSSGYVERWTHQTLFLLFAVFGVLVLLQQFSIFPVLTSATWPEPTFLVAALLVTVSSLARQIPLQSALMASVVIALVGGAAHWTSYLTGVPFGPLRFPHATGTLPFQEWFCVPAVLWVVLLVNARGVARVVLERQTKRRNHGYHVLGLSAVLMALIALALEPFATRAHHYWLWGETRLPITWVGVPLSVVMAWGVVSAIGLMAATATMIDKHPRPGPPLLEPLWIWAMLGGFLSAGNAAAGLWMPMSAALVNVGLALGWAVVAIRRRRPAVEGRGIG